MGAKKQINYLIKKYYSDAMTAKENGEKIGWATITFPQELIEAMGLTVMYPENHAAMAAARGKGLGCCKKAETVGFSGDICSYARMNLGYCIDNDLLDDKIPEPDYLLCCTNICHQILKWFEYLQKKYNIPLILIDIPYSTEYFTKEERLQYVKIQFQEAIYKLENITGHIYDKEKLLEVMKISSESGRWWNQIMDLLRGQTSLRGTDLFNYMGIVVCQRGKQSTAEGLHALYDEISEQNRKQSDDNISGWDNRILYEGLCCWPGFIKLAVSFTRYKINMVGAAYASAFGIEYQTFEDMLQSYIDWPNIIDIECSTRLRGDEIEQKKCEGILVHMSRSCKIWSGIMYEMIRQLERKYGLPVAFFDGDQADIRCFSEAQFETRMQGLYEMLRKGEIEGKK